MESGRRRGCGGTKASVPDVVFGVNSAEATVIWHFVGSSPEEHKIAAAVPRPMQPPPTMRM